MILICWINMISQAESEGNMQKDIEKELILSAWMMMLQLFFLHLKK